eukprot:gene17325-35745_t
MAVIIDAGMREMVTEQRDVFYYVTLMNENYAQPSLPEDWVGGFLCPCHGSTFDMAGRVFKNKPAPDNLEVPPHIQEGLKEHDDMAEFKEISPNASATAKVTNWFENRFPTAFDAYRVHMSEYYAPKNFNFWYIFGSLALLVLVIQIVTGIFLVMHYKPDASLAFASVEYIMRDVPWG